MKENNIDGKLTTSRLCWGTFFIMIDDAPHTDGDFVPFGRGTSEIDVADDIIANKRQTIRRSSDTINEN